MDWEDELFYNVYQSSGWDEEEGSWGNENYAEDYWWEGDYQNPDNPNPHWMDIMAKGYEYCVNGECEWLVEPSTYHDSLLEDAPEFYDQIYNMSPEDAAEWMSNHDNHGNDHVYAYGIGLQQHIDSGVFDLRGFDAFEHDYSKYFTAYDETREGLVSEMTDESIEKMTDEYGGMNQLIASKTGKFNLESGRANDLWTGLKDTLSRKINLEEIEEDLEIRGLRDRYERGFYNQALVVGRATPLFLNPDYEDDD